MRLLQAEAIQNDLPESEKEGGKAFQKIICYHGGLYATEVKKSINEVIDGFHQDTP